MKRNIEAFKFSNYGWSQTAILLLLGIWYHKPRPHGGTMVRKEQVRSATVARVPRDNDGAAVGVAAGTEEPRL